MQNEKILEFTLDEYGRILIANPALLESISGAISMENFNVGDANTVCHDDGGCGNSSCSD